MKEPLVTIVIPCYNHGAFLEETLESISKATNKYIPEIIIVNDGSTDALTLSAFERVEAQGYFVLHQENQGLAKARNNGIRLAKGKYILPLDSDNNVLPPYLNEAIDILEKKSIDVVYGNAMYIGEKKGLWKNKHLDKRRILITNQIDACAIFKKEIWEKVGGYSEDMPYMGCEDWNFWLKCIDKGFVFLYLNEVCFQYRVLSSSMIRTAPDDFVFKINSYNMSNLQSLYLGTIKEDVDIMHNIFQGNILKKIGKLCLNHFNWYKY